MFAKLKVVTHEAQEGIAVRLYQPTRWGRLCGYKTRWTLVISNAFDAPFVCVAKNPVRVELQSGIEHELTQSCVIYADDRGPEGAPFNVSFTLKGGKLIRSLWMARDHSITKHVFEKDGSCWLMKQDE
jgi:hypothetical protein